MTVRYRNELATFEVVDTGIGIAPPDIDRIFEPFERGSDSAAHRRSGVGLGLSITRAPVHIMGGDIKVASATRRGSQLPVRLMTSPPLPTPARALPHACMPRRSTEGRGG